MDCTIERKLCALAQAPFIPGRDPAFHISLKMSIDSADTSYVCDTLPAPRLASVQSVRSPSPPSSFQVTDDLDARTMAEDESLPESSDVQNAPAQRKLCVRHQRMADEGTNLKL